MSNSLRTRLQPVVDDLQRIFGTRLKAVVGYGRSPADRAPSMALVSSLTLEDLGACAARTAHWHRSDCATPLVLTDREFARSLDAFPIEYGEIMATGQLVAGADPFEGLTIGREDLRGACEVQVKSHIVHLREDYLESRGRPARVGALVRESAPAFAALLRHLAVLEDVPVNTNVDLIAFASHRVGLDGRVVGDVLALVEHDSGAGVDAVRLFPAYLAATERLAEFVDQWRDAQKV